MILEASRRRIELAVFHRRSTTVLCFVFPLPHALFIETRGVPVIFIFGLELTLSNVQATAWTF